MTPERLVRIKENAKKYEQIICWSKENPTDWNEFVFQSHENAMDIGLVHRLLDDFKQKGFMELYYLLICQMSETLSIQIEDMDTFVDICTDKHIRKQLREGVDGD